MFGDELQAAGAIEPVPPFLLGRTVALLASGPSLTPRQVWECSQAGFALVGCNNQAIYALDAIWVPGERWLDDINPRVAHIPHRFTTVPPSRRRSTKNPPRYREDWQYLETDPNIGWSEDPTTLARGQHAGFQMINLAALAGATRILLLGYDGRLVPGKERHWFGPHPPGHDVDSKYDDFNLNYRRARGPLHDAGIEIVNATEGSAIDAFRQMPMPEVLKRWG